MNFSWATSYRLSPRFVNTLPTKPKFHWLLLAFPKAWSELRLLILLPLLLLALPLSRSLGTLSPVDEMERKSEFGLRPLLLLLEDSVLICEAKHEFAIN